MRSIVSRVQLDAPAARYCDTYGSFEATKNERREVCEMNTPKEVGHA